MAGFTDPSLAIWLTVPVAFLGFVACLLGVWLVERMGRRPLTLGSLGGVAATLLLIVRFHTGAHCSSLCCAISLLPLFPSANQRHAVD